MRKTALILLLGALSFCSAVNGQRLLYERHGAVVQIKEKYGCSIVDTVYQIEERRGQYVTYDKYDREKGWYPKENHSITIIERIKK